MRKHFRATSVISGWVSPDYRPTGDSPVVVDYVAVGCQWVHLTFTLFLGLDQVLTSVTMYLSLVELLLSGKDLPDNRGQ